MAVSYVSCGFRFIRASRETKKPIVLPNYVRLHYSSFPPSKRLTLILFKLINKSIVDTRDEKWSSLPDNTVVEYGKIANCSLPRTSASRLGHNRLPSHAFELATRLYDPGTTKNKSVTFAGVIFARPGFNDPRAPLFLRLRSPGVPLNTVNILCSTTTRVVFF